MVIVQEYMDGGPLQAAAGGKDCYLPISEADARAMFQDILSGLSHMHQHNIAHGDHLKPENMMMTCSGIVKLIDFGSAR